MNPDDIQFERVVRPGEQVGPDDEHVLDPQNPPSVALVILPFLTKQQAEQFAVLVMATYGPDFATPIVTTGTAYEYLDTESGETGQVFELFPDARWEAFIKDDNEQHHVLQRTIREASVDE